MAGLDHSEEMVYTNRRDHGAITLVTLTLPGALDTNAASTYAKLHNSLLIDLLPSLQSEGLSQV